MRALLVVVAVAACKGGAPAPHVEPVTSPPVVVVAAAPDAAAPDAAAPDVALLDAAPAEPRRAVSLVVEPQALAAVDAAGGSLAALFGAPTARDTAALAAASPRYLALVATIVADLDALAVATPSAGVGVRGNMHRLFDATWLKSSRARFDLVGIAPRLDRARLPHECGDIRLIYRLAYETTVGGERVTSRVPMTLSVSLAPRPNDVAKACRADAEAWRAPTSVASDPAALGRWLVSADGPLGNRALEPSRVSLVLSNLQLLRTPSANAPALGGHAEYRLRAFVVDANGTLVAAPLDNTPDVARIAGDAKLRADLLAWLREEGTLDRIDAGLHRLPAHLLATEATSYSPYGLARPANQSYRTLIDRRDLAALPLANRRTIASPEALLRRLDEQTCNGCHQVRSVAGFHLVGVDPPAAPAGVALAVAYSPLVTSERTRRAAIIDALAAGNTADFTRPPAPAELTPTAPAGIGEACEVGHVQASKRGPRNDSLGRKRDIACADGLTCTKVRGGFPGGMCQASCDALPDGAACGVIAVNPFNDCLGSGTAFSKCMRHVRPIGLARCDDSRACRDDYVCARTPAGDGACLPPYFLFPLRVDGHPAL